MPTSVVVTGAARGIGRGIAELMVGRGHRVVVTDVDADGAAATAAEIGAAEGLCHDVSDPAAHRAVAGAAARHGVPAAWFNNAGVGDDGSLADLTEEQVRRLVDVNLLGTVWGMRAAIEAFGDRGGDIVNTASLSGLGPVPGYSVYAATKAAIVSASMSVDAESPRNVRVHALCPDGVQTAMLDGADAGLAGQPAGPLRRPDPHRRRGRRAAVGLVGSRRVVRTVPAWRGAVVRGSALAPSLARRACASSPPTASATSPAAADRRRSRCVAIPGRPGIPAPVGRCNP